MLSLKIYVPEGIKEKTEVDCVTINTKIGEISVFPEHMRLLSVLEIGEMELEIGCNIRIFAVAGGILKTQNSEVEIFSHAVEEKHEIDSERAEEAKERAEQRKNKVKEDKGIDMLRAQCSLLRAINRLKVTAK